MNTMPFLHRISFALPANHNNSQYPFSVPLFQENFNIDIKEKVVFLSGENGIGKSTLLELLAYECGFNINGGNRDHLYGKQRNDAEKLLPYLKFHWRKQPHGGFFMRAESLFSFADFIEEQASEFGSRAYSYYGGRSLHDRSHGEAFLALFENRFDKKGIYLLDEPEAAMSPHRLLSFMALLRELTKGKDVQFIISTHSPILMAYPYSQLYYITTDGISEMKYTNTEHYQLTKNFLDCPDRYFAHLFESEE
ncbi:MAG: AAA family ATPase [Oscillospiraceae bacterium]|jgi:predicted ATPase|nr:AAA family ATPase [Oscillospiraceae bacterium]